MTDLTILTDKDNNAACAAMRRMQAESETSDSVYRHMGELFALLDDDNSYVRNRALALISCNARWDSDGVIDRKLDSYLEHLADPKPITARYCAKGLPEIAKWRPGLRGRILRALEEVDASGYSESMRPLVERDIAVASAEIRGM